MHRQNTGAAAGEKRPEVKPRTARGEAEDVVLKDGGPSAPFWESCCAVLEDGLEFSIYLTDDGLKNISRVLIWTLAGDSGEWYAVPRVTAAVVSPSLKQRIKSEAGKTVAGPRAQKAYFIGFRDKTNCSISLKDPGVPLEAVLSCCVVEGSEKETFKNPSAATLDAVRRSVCGSFRARPPRFTAGAAGEEDADDKEEDGAPGGEAHGRLPGARPGAALALLALLTVLSIFAGFALFSYSLKQQRLEQSRIITQDITTVVSALYSHYANFIEVAGRCLDEYDEAAPDLSEAAAAWSGSGQIFSVPSGGESLDGITDRLDLGSLLPYEPFTGKNISSVEFDSEIQSTFSKPSGLPGRWTVMMTVNLARKNAYSPGRVRELLSKKMEYLSPLHKNRFISINIVKIEEDEIVIILDCRLIGEESFTFSSYEM